MAIDLALALGSQFFLSGWSIHVLIAFAYFIDRPECKPDPTIGPYNVCLHIGFGMLRTFI